MIFGERLYKILFVIIWSPKTSVKDRQWRNQVTRRPACSLESTVIFEERLGRRFCGRHTGPVAVEFTVFLRATLQPPLSTRVEHTLAVETISLSSLPTPMRAPSWKREIEKERKRESERARREVRRRKRPVSPSHVNDVSRIMTLIIAGRVNLCRRTIFKRYSKHKIKGSFYNRKVTDAPFTIVRIINIWWEFLSRNCYNHYLMFRVITSYFILSIRV